MDCLSIQMPATTPDTTAEATGMVDVAHDETKLQRALVGGGVFNSSAALFLAFFRAPGGVFLRARPLGGAYYGILAAIAAFGTVEVAAGFWVAGDPCRWLLGRRRPVPQDGLIDSFVPFVREAEDPKAERCGGAATGDAKQTTGGAALLQAEFRFPRGIGAARQATGRGSPSIPPARARGGPATTGAANPATRQAPLPANQTTAKWRAETGRPAVGSHGRLDPCLLAVAFVAAAWVSSVSSVPEQASGSQKSANCMPCSRAYVADAYLDALTGQLAQHRDLTEVPDTAGLCKVLADDLDVPALSEVHRHLAGEGSHRCLVYSVKFGNCRDTVVKFLDSYDANLVIIEKLPSGVLADPFELQHFGERKVFLDVAVFGDTNLELPASLSNRSAVEIHFDLKPRISTECNLVVELPLHARYPPLDASGYATVEFGSPDLLLRYRKKETHPDSCLWVLKDLDIAPVEKAVWRVPCGDEGHAGFVSSLTFISALVCSMSIVVAASLIS